MFSLDVRDNIAEVLARVEARAKSIPVATSNALNTTAFKVKEAEVQEMSRVFDRPTRFTLNSLFVRRATAQSLRVVVFLKERREGTHYLRPQIWGGERLLKGFEAMMHRNGVLPLDMYAVPGEGARLDAHGNMSRGQLMQVMSALGMAERYAGYSANRTGRSAKRQGRKLQQFFVGRPGGGKLPLGVWQSFRFAMGTAVKPILIFVRKPRYHPRFKFFEVAQRVAEKSFPIYFERELRGIPTGLSLGFTGPSS